MSLDGPGIGVPNDVPITPAALAGLDHVGPATPHPFLVEGEGLWIAGVGTRSGFRVGRGRDVVATVRVEPSGGVAGMVSFPGLVRRELVGPGGSSVETLMVAPRLPLAMAQWAAAPTAPRLVVEVGGFDGLRRLGDACVVAERGTDIVAVALVSRSLATTVVDDANARVTFTPTPEQPMSLLVSTGPLESVRAALSAARHMEGHRLRATAGPEEGLLVRSGVTEIDDGVRWLRSRLAARCHADASLMVGLAAVACGEREAARALIRRLEDPTEGAVLAARYAATFGEGGVAGATLRSWLSRIQSGDVQTDTSKGRLAARLLADAVDPTVPPETVAQLRTRAGSSAETSGGPAKRGERTLPMAGRDPSGHGDTERPTGPSSAWLEALLAGSPRGNSGGARERVARTRRATNLFLTDPNAAWAEWRGLLSEPITRGTSAFRGTPLWDGPPDAAPAEFLAGELLLSLYHGMLGLAPDASVGRLRLAPRLPDHLTSFGVTGIALGATALGFRYERDSAALRFEFTPETARVPPVLIFEPSVPGAVRSASIDGEPVALDTRVERGRTVVPVQLPVDGARVVEIAID